MFCALVAIVALLVLLICGVTISAIDIEDYNFGLYYALLAIVGMMVACAICVLKPPNCKNPKWYDDCCLNIELYVAPNTAPAPASSTYGGVGVDPQRSRSDMPGIMNRRTLVMLGPAVQLMQSVMRGLTSETEFTMDDDDLTVSKLFDDSSVVSDVSSMGGAGGFRRLGGGVVGVQSGFSNAESHPHRKTAGIGNGNNLTASIPKNHKLLTAPVAHTVPETIVEEPTLIASSCSKNSVTITQIEQMIESLKQQNV